MHYDVFNGDADGITALIQLRLSEPKTSRLITGVKRDISLLTQVSTQDDVSSVTVLDVSMEKNRAELNQLLVRDIEVFYCDHHRCGDIPQSANLTSIIDLTPDVCTSLLINQHLGNQHPLWAVAGAYGDNLFTSADELAHQLGLNEQQRAFLCELGTLINYNGYGNTLSDLHIAPALLFEQLLQYRDPFSLLDDEQSPYFILKQGFEQDMSHADRALQLANNAVCRVFELPNETWARRVSGVMGNQLANQEPGRAHAVLTLNPNHQDYTVSVRAPLNNRTGADAVCASFPTGGGRAAAAGINALPIDLKDDFVETLTQFYQK